MSITVYGDSFGRAQINPGEPGMVRVLIGVKRINGSLIYVAGTVSTKIGHYSRGQWDSASRRITCDAYRCDVQGNRNYNANGDYRSDQPTWKQNEKAEAMLRDAAEQLTPEQIEQLEQEREAGVLSSFTERIEELKAACTGLVAFLDQHTPEQIADADADMQILSGAVVITAGSFNSYRVWYKRLLEYRRKEQEEE